DGASVTLERMVVTNCSITDADGGAIFLTGNFPSLITRECTFSNNQAFPDIDGSTGQGGALAFSTIGGTFLGDNIAVVGNQAKGAGGLWARSTVCHLQNSVVSSNTAFSGGGIGVFNDISLGDTFFCNNTEISHNLANGSAALDGGGGILILNANLCLESSTISFNSAPIRHGGGLSVASMLSPDELPHVKATDTVFFGNDAYNGGGIYILAATFTACSNVSVFGNSAANGGGIALWGGNFGAEDIEVYGNTVSPIPPDSAYGGGIFWNSMLGATITTNGNPWQSPQSVENPFSVDLFGNIHTTPVPGDPVQVYDNSKDGNPDQMHYYVE
ncbi:MAG TPA: hypothetical protein P5560_13795, partial [Thermotogota bacterium]|nr:hypothetical protein [Thermotogota bacterium]